MRPYGCKRKDRWYSSCPCCNVDKWWKRDKMRKSSARQYNKKEIDRNVQEHSA